MIEFDTTVTGIGGKWSCENKNKNSTWVYVMCQDATYLTCTVTTQRETKTISLLTYTRQCVYLVDLSVDNIGVDDNNGWVEVSWQCSADSCEVHYGIIEDTNHYQSRIVYTNHVRLTDLDTQNYWWKVKAFATKNHQLFLLMARPSQ